MKRGPVLGSTQTKLRVFKTPPGHTGLTRVVQNYKGNARHRGIPFELTREDIKTITSLPCHYCGIEPKQIAHHTGPCVSARQIEWGSYVYNGIDRQDSSKSYCLSNVVPCCWDCNLAKSDKSVDEFLAFVARVHAHLAKKAV